MWSVCDFFVKLVGVLMNVEEWEDGVKLLVVVNVVLMYCGFVVFGVDVDVLKEFFDEFIELVKVCACKYFGDEVDCDWIDVYKNGDC